MIVWVPLALLSDSNVRRVMTEHDVYIIINRVFASALVPVGSEYSHQRGHTPIAGTSCCFWIVNVLLESQVRSPRDPVCDPRHDLPRFQRECSSGRELPLPGVVEGSRRECCKLDCFFLGNVARVIRDDLVSA